MEIKFKQTMEKDDIKLNFLHICDYASFGDGGKLNILGIFKNINAPKFPVVHPQLFVVTNVNIAKSGNFKETIRIIDEDNNDIMVSPLEFKLSSTEGLKKDGKAELGVVAQVNNLRFSKTGDYKVQVYIDNKLVGQTPLMVSQIIRV
jgi:hypothetical protein